MKVLLVGSGGREHAMAWKLAQSPEIEELYCAPGNAGIAEHAAIIDVAADDVVGLTAIAKNLDIGFVIVGPEIPLALGLVDILQANGIAAFGPTQDAAQLESSKAFTKDFCKRYNIPTADYELFSDLESAVAYVHKNEPPFVLKADGLAAGKGVVIADSKFSAEDELKEFFSGKFGDAGTKVLIEEFMTGQEASFFAICDGKTALPLIAAQDHKRAYDNDEGPNTGGMGAYSPAPVFGDKEMAKVMKTIIHPTVAGMKKDGMPFMGILFAGLMMTKKGPKLIEYNVRFGDPECQVLMRRLGTDLMELLLAASAGKLDKVTPPAWLLDPVVNVVMAANGYPGKYKKGSVIKGLETANLMNGVQVFHAGTKTNDKNQLVSNGGRVLSVTASGETIGEAVERAYAAIDEAIVWKDGFCRRDIAHHALS